MWRRAAVVLVLCQVLAGCSLGASGDAPAADAVSPAKLRILRESFAHPSANAINGFIHLVGMHLRPYAAPTGSVVAPLIHRPYDATPQHVRYVVRPNAWAAVQLDFQIRNPCTHWAQTIYDRTVEVTYTQGDPAGHIQEVPMVPLNITRLRDC